jgi:hypothetical protein
MTSKYNINPLEDIFPLTWLRVRVDREIFFFTLEALEDVQFYIGVSFKRLLKLLKTGYYDRLFEALARNGLKTVKSGTLLRYHSSYPA